jgi:replicative DNA helicase
VKLVALDYIQIASMTGGNDRRDLDLGKLTRGFKGLCLEFGISCIILSQLNRSADREGGRDPQIGDLRDSQSMEADSDVILLLNQNLMKDSDDDPEYRDASVSLVKNRCGGTGKFDCRFHKKTASFVF